MLYDEEISSFPAGPLKPPIDDRVDILHSRFPLCIVWTPLPIVSWLAPFVGHVGVCREDGSILDFSGSCLVNFDNFAFGTPARYTHLDREKCCFPPHLSGHTCLSGFQHSTLGTATSWDDALRICMRSYQQKSFNLFTCNSHSFVSCFLNKIAYQGYIDWNVISIVVLVFLKGQWVNTWAICRSLSPFILVMCLGYLVAGLPFFVGWAIFQVLLVGWFMLVIYMKLSFIEH